MLKIIYLFLMNHWLTLLLLTVFAGAGLIYIFRERRQYEKKFEAIAQCIDAAAEGRNLPKQSETEETLPSKTYHQLMRIQKIQQDTIQKISKERDNTQKLITEIAHQLRTPLTNIQNYTELLYDSGLEKEERKKYLAAVSESEKKLSFLVESFIKMSRLENQLIQISFHSDNLKETVLQALFQLREKAENKKLQISIEQPENVKILHDSNWLGEAIYNILDNSVKYSPEGGKIDICIRQNEMFTEITVRDYGIGIEPGEEAAVFQRFYRGKRVTKEAGFGIGLYLSREIILKHGGFIRVKRREPGLQVSVFLS